MRFSLSMIVLALTLTGFSASAVAEAEKSLSPLQTQLQKKQSGEQYGMKTVVVEPAQTVAPKEGLNENAKALAEKAAVEMNKPTRLELIQEAYKKAAPPADANKPSATKDTDAKPETKKDIPDGDQVMFKTLQDDRPKIPPRLIPVE
jgi:hypothetical protein